MPPASKPITIFYSDSHKVREAPGRSGELARPPEAARPDTRVEPSRPRGRREMGRRHRSRAGFSDRDPAPHQPRPDQLGFHLGAGAQAGHGPPRGRSGQGDPGRHPTGRLAGVAARRPAGAAEERQADHALAEPRFRMARCRQGNPRGDRRAAGRREVEGGTHRHSRDADQGLARPSAPRRSDAGKRAARKPAAAGAASAIRRTVYTADNSEQLPGQVARREGDPVTGDVAVDEASRLHGGDVPVLPRGLPAQLRRRQGNAPQRGRPRRQGVQQRVLERHRHHPRRR